MSLIYRKMGLYFFKKQSYRGLLQAQFSISLTHQHQENLLVTLSAKRDKKKVGILLADNYIMNSTQRKRTPRAKVSGNSRPNSQNKRQQPSRKGPQKSNLNPEMLIKKAGAVEKNTFKSQMNFDDMPLSAALKENLKKKGFVRPTEIQERTFDDLKAGRNMLGIANTGTGKTGAFLIPVIEQLLEKNQKPFALVVVPTRELAVQVEEEFRSITKGLKLFSACFIGGTNINKDMQTLRRDSNIVIGTPGRLLDLVSRKLLDLRKFNTLILDEFDRMLDMGFVNDIKRILSGMHVRKQTMLFSATLDKTQERLISEILIDPVTVKVSNGVSTGDHIDQEVIHVGQGEDKFAMLKDMLDQGQFSKVLVFEETKHRVSRLCKKLNKSGIRSGEIHGNKSQNARQRALEEFKSGKTDVLVATDVAARGIDVSDVTHVINYQMPMTFDSYIHRIGRTGRNGKTGKAFTFVEG